MRGERRGMRDSSKGVKKQNTLYMCVCEEHTKIDVCDFQRAYTTENQQVLTLESGPCGFRCKKSLIISRIAVLKSTLTKTHRL